MRSQLFAPVFLAAAWFSTLPAQAESYHFTPSLQQSFTTIVIFQNQQGTLYGSDTLSAKTLTQLARAANAAEFRGKQGQLLELLAPNDISADRIILVGLGDKKLTSGEVNELGGALAQRLAELPSQDIGILVESMPEGSTLQRNSLTVLSYRVIVLPVIVTLSLSLNIIILLLTMLLLPAVTIANCRRWKVGYFLPEI